MTQQMPNRFRRALAGPVKERPVLDAVATTSEAVADILWKDELFAAVPVFSMVFKTVKALDSFRDRMFEAKLAEFLRAADGMPPSAREHLSQKLMLDDEGRKAAETIMLVLERVTDMDKPALLGFLLTQLGLGRIKSQEMRRLATAIDMAFADDLVDFLDESVAGVATSNALEHREALVPSGLTRQVTDGSAPAYEGALWEPTPIGKLLHALIAEQGAQASED